MTDLLKALWASSQGLYERFDVYPPDLEAQTRVFDEEVEEFKAEFSIELERLLGFNGDSEAVDVLVTMMGMLMARGCTYLSLQLAVQAVIDKNNAKTHETHAVNAKGKIARRE